jgi:hypothetical protein
LDQNLVPDAETGAAPGGGPIHGLEAMTQHLGANIASASGASLLGSSQAFSYERMVRATSAARALNADRTEV